MSFSPSISVTSVSPGVIQLMDNSLLNGYDVLGNFTLRTLTIVTSAGTPLPNALGSLSVIPLRTIISWPIMALTGDSINIPTNIMWDTVLSITTTYTPQQAQSGSVYTNLVTTYTCSFINQCFLQNVDKFYVQGQITDDRNVILLNKKISNSFDALDIAMATGDLVDAQSMINLLQDLCLDGGGCAC